MSVRNGSEDVKKTSVAALKASKFSLDRLKQTPPSRPPHSFAQAHLRKKLQEQNVKMALSLYGLKTQTPAISNSWQLVRHNTAMLSKILGYDWNAHPRLPKRTSKSKISEYNDADYLVQRSTTRFKLTGKGKDKPFRSISNLPSTKSLNRNASQSQSLYASRDCPTSSLPSLKPKISCSPSKKSVRSGRSLQEIENWVNRQSTNKTKSKSRIAASVPSPSPQLNLVRTNATKTSAAANGRITENLRSTEFPSIKASHELGSMTSTDSGNIKNKLEHASEFDEIAHRTVHESHKFAKTAVVQTATVEPDLCDILRGATRQGIEAWTDELAKRFIDDFVSPEAKLYEFETDSIFKHQLPQLYSIVQSVRKPSTESLTDNLKPSLSLQPVSQRLETGIVNSLDSVDTLKKQIESYDVHGTTQSIVTTSIASGSTFPLNFMADSFTTPTRLSQTNMELHCTVGSSPDTGYPITEDISTPRQPVMNMESVIEASSGTGTAESDREIEMVLSSNEQGFSVNSESTSPQTHNNEETSIIHRAASNIIVTQDKGYESRNTEANRYPETLTGTSQQMRSKLVVNNSCQAVPKNSNHKQNPNHNEMGYYLRISTGNESETNSNSNLITSENDEDIVPVNALNVSLSIEERYSLPAGCSFKTAKIKGSRRKVSFSNPIVLHHAKTVSHSLADILKQRSWDHQGRRTLRFRYPLCGSKNTS